MFSCVCFWANGVPRCPEQQQQRLPMSAQRHTWCSSHLSGKLSSFLDHVYHYHLVTEPFASMNHWAICKCDWNACSSIYCEFDPAKRSPLAASFLFHIQQLFYSGSGLSMLSSNQSSHLWFVFAHASLGWFCRKNAPWGILKKSWRQAAGRYVPSIYVPSLSIKIDTGYICVFFWSHSCEQNQIGETKDLTRTT